MTGRADRVLGIFAKEPVPGLVKTRLARATSPEWAAQVAAAFLYDTLDRCAHIDARRFVAFAPDEARPYFDAAAHGRYELVPQSGGDLGERMRTFIEARLREGAERVVLIGTDSPTVPLAYIEQAFELLAGADMVVGPATDGGYYLIGCGPRVPPVFEGIDWGTARVLGQTMKRLDESWRVAVLPPWYDVDTADDWQALCGHLAALRRAGVEVNAPRTEGLALATPQAAG